MHAQAFSLPDQWPHPYDEDAAGRLVERFRDLGRAEADLTDVPHVLTMLRSLGGHSPYLADLAIRESQALGRLVTLGPDIVVADVLKQINDVPTHTQRLSVASILRQAKRVIALVTAIADLGGIWRLETITATLSDFAEAALRLAIGHLLRIAHDTGKIRLPDAQLPSMGSGFAVIAMGKLGARELNYSSDIDLVLIYDRACGIYAGQMAEDAIGPFTSRLARDLVTLMQARDVNGYVFRTDLRLRPDPAATPPAVSLDAAVAYYESLGQNWERAAMIKARPMAGDLALGHRFLDAISPFVWRRGLDFAAMADIHAMKRRIDLGAGATLQTAADPVARIAGRNVKLGAGGIREIELLVQTLQLVWGGRDPTARLSPTLSAIDAMVTAGHLSEDFGGKLQAAYRFLRQVEHRLQMIADRQTHDLPKKDHDLDRFAGFMGSSSATEFAIGFLRHVVQVREIYQAVFEHVPDPPSGELVRSDLDFRGDDPMPSPTVGALTEMGYRAPEQIVATVRRWFAGHIRALRSARARELMMTMMPAILTTFGRQANPDEAFNRFDRFVTALPSGVQPMSLFQHNPTLLDRIAAVLGAAPFLSEHLARFPSALEGLLVSEEDRSPRAVLRTRIGVANGLEEAIQIIRRSVKERDFLLSVGTLEGRLDADAAGLHRTALADAALSLLIPRVLSDFSTRFGSVREGALAMVAMGKAGGREMMTGSDLDLILIYDHPSDMTESQGARNLPTSQWFVRATHAIVAALTAPGSEGRMYAVDMRLRPSGNKGPVAVSFESFTRYQMNDAWTWERMALTRARVVCGSATLRKRISQAIREAIHRGDDPGEIRADATAMRARMLHDLRAQGPWDVKQRPGGLVEVEFIAQVLQLVHAREHPSVSSPTTRIAFRRLRDAGLLGCRDAAVLIHADHVWRTIQGMLRVTVGQIDTDVLPAASVSPLLRAAALAGVSAATNADLLRKLDDIAHQVRNLFVRHVGDLNR